MEKKTLVIGIFILIVCLIVSIDARTVVKNNSENCSNITEVCNGVDDNCNDQIDEIGCNCYNSTDCGTDQLLDKLFCKNNNVFDKYVIYICNNPGKINSQCVNYTSNVLRETCVFGCTSGICNLNPCVDSDEDGYDTCNPGAISDDGKLKDCNDLDLNVYPSAVETCNGIDDDCDNEIDENLSNIYYGVDVGECKQEIRSCVDGNYEIFQDAVDPSVEICDGLDNDCDGKIDEEKVCPAFNFSINLPVEGLYSSKTILVDLVSDIKVDKMTYIDNSANRGRFVLCNSCSRYNSIMRFNDGEHDITFSAVSGNNSVSKNVKLFVDSRKPQLFLPNLRLRGYTNGGFSIIYTENNLANITMVYGIGEDIRQYSQECGSGVKKSCQFNVNLSDFNGRTITYSFIAMDKSGNYFQTKNLTALVDVIKPVLVNENNFTSVEGDYVMFSMNITDSNFFDVSYIDHSERVPRWKKLCTRLTNGFCNKGIRFSVGNHDITLRISDKAGNFIEENI